MQATIVAKYINPPQSGKKRWTIKDESDVLWGAMPDVAKLFVQGAKHEITYREEVYRGTTYKVVETVKVTEAAPPQASGGRQYGGGDLELAKRIFVCGAFNAWMGKHETPSLEAMIAIVGMLEKVWHATLGRNQQKDDEMNDEIPF